MGDHANRNSSLLVFQKLCGSIDSGDNLVWIYDIYAVYRKNYQTSVYYIDVVNEMEKMGDFMINISQDLERAFINK